MRPAIVGPYDTANLCSDCDVDLEGSKSWEPTLRQCGCGCTEIDHSAICASCIADVYACRMEDAIVPSIADRIPLEDYPTIAANVFPA